MATCGHEKSVTKYHKVIETFCSREDVPNNVIDEAKDYYSSLDDFKRRTKNKRKEGVIRGNRLVGILAACVLEASKKKASEHMDQLSLTETDVSKMFKIDKEYVSHGIKDLKKILFKETPSVMISKKTPQEERKMRVANYIETFAIKMSPKSHKDDIKMNPWDINCAKYISEKLLDYKITTKSTPTSTAATAITLVKLRYDLKTVSRQEISETCSVSDVTINKILKSLREKFKSKGTTKNTPYTSPIYDRLFPTLEQIDVWKDKYKNTMKTFKTEIISVGSEDKL